MTKRDKTNDPSAASGESFASLVKKKGAGKRPKSSFASLVKKSDSADDDADDSKAPSKPKSKRAPTTAGATTRKRASTKSTKTSTKAASSKSGSRKAGAKSGTAKRASTKSSSKSGTAKRASTKAGSKSGTTKRASTKSSSKSGTTKRASTKAGSKSGTTKRASTKSGAKKASPKSSGASRKSAAASPAANADERSQTPTKLGETAPTRASVPDGVVASAEPVQRYETVVAVFENGASNQKRAVDVSQALGYSAVDTRRDVGKLRGLISSPTPPELLIVGLPGGETVVRDVRELSGDALIIATLPGPAESARKRALEVGADLFVVRPHTKDSLAVVLLAAEELLRARRALSAANAKEASLRGQLREIGREPSTSGFHSLEFFQRVLIMEIKRAKRFGYSLASALIGFEGPGVDGQLSDESSESIEQKLRERVASAVRANIRDIDLPVDYADGRTLLFLPYTDLDGAHEVGRRVAEAVRQFGHVEIDGRSYSCSVSIGISAVRPGNPISFARLMKDAKQALRAAQLKGGGQIVVRR